MVFRSLLVCFACETIEDCRFVSDDPTRKDKVKRFSREYAKFHDLGDVAVWETSDTPQVDLYGEPLGNYCIIFGRVLSWDEIKWHVQEAYRLGMVDKKFKAIREFGSITIRVNSKNNRIPPPKPLYYFRNGDDTGIRKFVDYWKMCKDLGN